MVNLVYCPTDLLFFDISLSYYFINLNLSMICSLFSGDIYIFLQVYLFCLKPLLKYFCAFGTFVILLAFLLPIKSPVASAVFWIAFFEAVSSAYVADCLAWSRNFWLYLLLKFLIIFWLIFYVYLPIFSAKDKNP